MKKLESRESKTAQYGNPQCNDAIEDLRSSNNTGKGYLNGHQRDADSYSKVNYKTADINHACYRWCQVRQDRLLPDKEKYGDYRADPPAGFGTLKLTHLEGKRQPKIDPPDRDLW